MKYINDNHSYVGLPMAAHICTMELLTYAPAVDAVEVMHGQWIRKRHRIFGLAYDYVCSVCGCDYALAEYTYCPNCGARMDGGK